MLRQILSVACALGMILGCAAPNTQLQKNLDDMKRDLAELTEGHKAQRELLEVMQDRVALLEDRYEAQALHRPVPNHLPVVRMTPPPTSPAETPKTKSKKKRVEEAPVTITQADLEAMKPRTVRPRRVAPPSNASRAGNVGVMAVPAPPAVGGPRGHLDDPVAFFKQAQALADTGNVVGGLREMATFVRTWPRHSFADNALYAMGRMRYTRAEYGAALDLFRRVVTEHPTGNQVPDALLMTGLTLDRLGQPAKARETLSRLKSMYPGTDAARRAGTELLNISGRM